MENSENTNIEENVNNTDRPEEKKDRNSKVIWAIRIGVAVIALYFIIDGLTRGEAGIVLNKAVNICLECIGLG